MIRTENCLSSKGITIPITTTRKKNTWTKVLAGNPEDGKTPYGHDARSVFYHDPFSGHGLLVQFQTNTLWVYQPDRKTWTKLAPKGDPMPTGRKRLAYFDQAHNVFVLIENTKVWVYRYVASL